ncbi:ARM repeat superfamily protein [Perilla frutescens var. frutescens]|nr:ARM repeat superfamily protein [Perilla frutescens var. frutescens]
MFVTFDDCLISVEQAILGFVKALVSCLTPNDLHHLLSQIMDGILRWSSISCHHFKEKTNHGSDLDCLAIEDALIV